MTRSHVVVLAAVVGAALAASACGPGLKSGVYRLDIGHLAQKMKARVGRMPEAVRAKMARADMRIEVDGARARLLSSLAKGEPPRFVVRKRGGKFVLSPEQGPSISCRPVAERSLDCTMPHGVMMRFTRSP